MTHDQFFEKMRSECCSDIEFVIELLKLRGFLFEEIDNKILFSDNNHRDDLEYLNELIVKYNLGYMNDEELIITHANYKEFIKNEFRDNFSQDGMKRASCWQSRDWCWFKRRKHGEKAPVSWLEPFIARYIKAISACCVLTVGSCDGNHHNRDKMYIMTERMGSIPWHKLICQKCLIDKYEINWLNDYTAMQFTQESKYSTYYNVNKAAEYLYNNREKIRQIKNTAFSEISNSFLRHHTSEEIEKEFIEKAAALFDASNL